MIQILELGENIFKIGPWKGFLKLRIEIHVTI
jgi:hypothetical protein